MRLPISGLPKRDHIAVMKKSWGSIPKIKPFEIDKSGFGSQAAWLTVDDVSRIRH